MGAWGVGVFENDAAGDWVWDLVKAEDGLNFLKETFDGIDDEFAEEDYIESGCEALAAAEVVAALKGKPVAGIEKEEELDNWLKRKPEPPTELVQQAVRAVELTMGEKSEQRELWEETGEDYETWKQQCNDLIARLKS